MGWLKTGKESKAIAEQVQVEQELRKAGQGKMWRFMLKPHETARITFVDGDLDEDGVLNPPRAFEHFDNRTSSNYICPQKTMPELGETCPLCEVQNWASLVGYFTIIDHRVIKSKDGKKEYKNRRRLYAPKPAVMEKLAKKAITRGGLAGTTWDISRGNDKTASSGDDFEFIEKTPIATLKTMYMEDVLDAKGVKTGVRSAFYAADYDTELVLLHEEELRKLGLGVNVTGGKSQSSSGGYIAPPHSSAAAMAEDVPPEDAEDLEQHL